VAFSITTLVASLLDLESTLKSELLVGFPLERLLVEELLE
jgi:predicted proteasome-type protease